MQPHCGRAATTRASARRRALRPAAMLGTAARAGYIATQTAPTAGAPDTGLQCSPHLHSRGRKALAAHPACLTTSSHLICARLHHGHEGATASLHTVFLETQPGKARPGGGTRPLPGRQRIPGRAGAGACSRDPAICRCSLVSRRTRYIGLKVS